jgi:HicB family
VLARLRTFGTNGTEGPKVLLPAGAPLAFAAVGRLHVVIDDELHRRAKARASLNGLTLQQYVEQAITDRVERDESENRTDR